MLILNLFFQSKHPHIVFQSDQKPNQKCGVSSSQLSSFARQRREATDVKEARREVRDVRHVNKFIETALVLDKAMVRSMRAYYVHFIILSRNISSISIFLTNILSCSLHIFPTIIFAAYFAVVTYSSSKVRLQIGLSLLIKFDNRPGLTRRDVMHEAIQVSNIADLVSFVRHDCHVSGLWSLLVVHIWHVTVLCTFNLSEYTYIVCGHFWWSMSLI